MTAVNLLFGARRLSWRRLLVFAVATALLVAGVVSEQAWVVVAVLFAACDTAQRLAAIAYAPTPAAGPRAELEALLLSLFDAPDLRRHVAPLGIAPELPELVSERELVARVVDELEKRGLVDHEFFDRLLEERPRRALEIARARAHWEAIHE